MNAEISNSAEKRLDAAIANTRAIVVPDFPRPVVDFPSDSSSRLPPSMATMRPATSSRWIATFSGVSLVAVASLLVFVVFSARPLVGFAQIADAMLKQSWLHVRIEATGQEPREQWFSPANDISVQKGSDSVRFEDHRQQVFHSYSPQEKVLYRGPVTWKLRQDNANLIVDKLKLIAQPDASQKGVDNQLALLEILGFERSKLVFLKPPTQQKNIVDGSLVDYVLTVRYADFSEPVTVLLQVESNSSLMKMITFEGTQNGSLVTRKMIFDYPKTGPADIFALGVPKDSKLVDRLPAGDLKRIVDSIRAGRERMDPYRAVYVSRTQKEDGTLGPGSPQLLYRKGNQTRRDLPSVHLSMREIPDSQDRTEQLKWWNKQLLQTKFLPTSIEIEATRYTFDTRVIDNVDGTQTVELASVQKFDNINPELIPLDYAFRPEHVCRPLLGIGNVNLEAKVELQPKGGPSGCIEVTFGENRWWVDPAKDYIAIRWEMGQEFTFETLEAAQSPSGVWYASKILQTSKLVDNNGKTTEYREAIDIYVDFDGELPDTLFEIQRGISLKR
jgi:hypothetical protein